jgi:hypothetical protein
LPLGRETESLRSRDTKEIFTAYGFILLAFQNASALSIGKIIIMQFKFF